MFMCSFVGCALLSFFCDVASGQSHLPRADDFASGEGLRSPSLKPQAAGQRKPREVPGGLLWEDRTDVSPFATSVRSRRRSWPRR